MWGEKKRLNLAEKPKGGRKRREGEPCDQALAGVQVLLSIIKILQPRSIRITVLLERNRRVSVTLSPTLTLFLEPHGKLYLKLRQVLAQLQVDGNTPLPPAKRRRPGPAKPKHGIPPREWPTVLRRITENQEPLRKVADDYGVSHETVRRVVRAARKQTTG